MIHEYSKHLAQSKSIALRSYSSQSVDQKLVGMSKWDNFHKDAERKQFKRDFTKDEKEYQTMREQYTF